MRRPIQRVAYRSDPRRPEQLRSGHGVRRLIACLGVPVTRTEEEEVDGQRARKFEFSLWNHVLSCLA